MNLSMNETHGVYTSTTAYSYSEYAVLGTELLHYSTSAHLTPNNRAI